MTEEGDLIEYFNKHPGWITGFMDAEGSFTLGIYKNNKCKSGYEVKVVFQICLHRRDEVLLKAYFGGVGNIYLKGDTIQFKVQSIKYFEKIIAHFEQNPLITVKRVSYQLFKQGVEMIKRKEHLTTEGLNKLISIKASINRGLSGELSEAFPDIGPVKLPLVCSAQITDPEWIAGFTSGEGCFFVQVRKHSWWSWISNSINLQSISTFSWWTNNEKFDWIFRLWKYI